MILIIKAAVVLGLAVILVSCVFIMAHLICSFFERREDRANQKKRNRLRNRAPIVHVGQKGSLSGWRFYIKPGVVYFSGIDPQSGETRLLGYSQEELDEISQRPAEFEQPDLKWFCREE